MTANLPTLNSSKTEFLLIWLENLIAKIHNSSVDTSHSARNLGFTFDEHFTFSEQITSLSEACYYGITFTDQPTCVRISKHNSAFAVFRNLICATVPALLTATKRLKHQNITESKNGQCAVRNLKQTL